MDQMKEEEDGATNPTFDTLRDVDEVCKSWNASPNYTLMLKVVQSINLNAPQVSSSVLSKIVSYLLGSEPHSIFYALLLLDACSRHCVDAFIRRMASRDVVKPVTRLVQKYWAKKSKFKLKKGQYKKPHVLIGELSARLVLHWSRSYLDQHRHPIYPIFRTSFETLRQRGDFKFNVSFPDANQPSEYGLEMFDDVVTVNERKGGRRIRTSSSSSSKPPVSYVNNDVAIPQIIERISIKSWESINLLRGLIKGLKPGETVEVEVGMAVVKQLEKDREVVNEYVQDFVKNEAVLKYLLRVSDAIDNVMKEYEKSERSVKTPRDPPALGYLPPPTAILPPPTSSQPLPSQPLSHTNPFTPFVPHTPPSQPQPFATTTPPTNPFLTNFSQTPSPVRTHSMPLPVNRRASSPAPKAKSPFAVDAADRRASNPFLPQGYQGQYQGQVLAQTQSRSPFASPAPVPMYNPFVTTPPS